MGGTQTEAGRKRLDVVLVESGGWLRELAGTEGVRPWTGDSGGVRPPPS